MIKNKFFGAIAAAAVIAFVTIPVTANAHGHKHACYGLEACKDKDAKGCNKHGAKMLSKKECKKMGGSTHKEKKEEEAKK